MVGPEETTMIDPDDFDPEHDQLDPRDPDCPLCGGQGVVHMGGDNEGVSECPMCGFPGADA